MSGSKVYLDINLFSTNAFVQNNMYYFPAGYKTIWNLHCTPGYLIHEGGEFKFDRTYNFYTNKKDKYLAVNEFILGPSVMFQNGRHSFGYQHLHCDHLTQQIIFRSRFQ